MKSKDYKKIAKNVIELEIEALKKLKRSINNSFNKAVHAIVNCQSKIIFCGVGKSSKISAKLSATFSSVGSPSFSLSAGDASHGDLGSISKKDILILISYSGETQELRNIIQYAKRNKITLIGSTLYDIPLRNYKLLFEYLCVALVHNLGVFKVGVWCVNIQLYK